MITRAIGKSHGVYLGKCNWKYFLLMKDTGFSFSQPSNDDRWVQCIFSWHFLSDETNRRWLAMILYHLLTHQICSWRWKSCYTKSVYEVLMLDPLCHLHLWIWVYYVPLRPALALFNKYFSKYYLLFILS